MHFLSPFASSSEPNPVLLMKSSHEDTKPRRIEGRDNAFSVFPERGSTELEE